jgi:hypothetical protein
MQLAECDGKITKSRNQGYCVPPGSARNIRNRPCRGRSVRPADQLGRPYVHGEAGPVPVGLVETGAYFG